MVKDTPAHILGVILIGLVGVGLGCVSLSFFSLGRVSWGIVIFRERERGRERERDLSSGMGIGSILRNLNIMLILYNPDIRPPPTRRARPSTSLPIRKNIHNHHSLRHHRNQTPNLLVRFLGRASRSLGFEECFLGAESHPHRGDRARNSRDESSGAGI